MHAEFANEFYEMETRYIVSKLHCTKFSFIVTYDKLMMKINFEDNIC